MTERPDLFGAVAGHIATKQATADEKARPEREAREARLKADAALHGTPGWEAIGPARRSIAAQWSAQQAKASNGGSLATDLHVAQGVSSDAS